MQHASKILGNTKYVKCSQTEVECNSNHHSYHIRNMCNDSLIPRSDSLQVDAKILFKRASILLIYSTFTSAALTEIK